MKDQLQTPGDGRHDKASDPRQHQAVTELMRALQHRGFAVRQVAPDEDLAQMGEASYSITYPLHGDVHIWATDAAQPLLLLRHHLEGLSDQPAGSIERWARFVVAGMVDCARVKARHQAPALKARTEQARQAALAAIRNLLPTETKYMSCCLTHCVGIKHLQPDGGLGLLAGGAAHLIAPSHIEDLPAEALIELLDLLEQDARR